MTPISFNWSAIITSGENQIRASQARFSESRSSQVRTSRQQDRGDSGERDEGVGDAVPGDGHPAGHDAEHDGDQPLFFAAGRTHAGQLGSRQFAGRAGLLQISGFTQR